MTNRILSIDSKNSIRWHSLRRAKRITPC
jgi:hypothetical protein